MCELKDAKYHEQLAQMQETKNQQEKAGNSYLEAASIYLLQAELQKDRQLLEKATQCYQKSKQMHKLPVPLIHSKQELAQHILSDSNRTPTAHILQKIQGVL